MCIPAAKHELASGQLVCLTAGMYCWTLPEYPELEPSPQEQWTVQEVEARFSGEVLMGLSDRDISQRLYRVSTHMAFYRQDVWMGDIKDGFPIEPKPQVDIYDSRSAR